MILLSRRRMLSQHDLHSALKDALMEWRSQTAYNGPGDFVFPSHRHKGRKPLDLAAVLRRKIQPAVADVGISGVGWYSFRHTVGTILAEMGEHQLTIMQVALPQVVAACRAACGQSAKSTLIQ